ncbi:hypothetical protein FSP39_000938 [Pinctada imbricata]|uniref:G-protein coupled receptors family 1 profile domain-containing protein n=1 Tax=Pinctada imbricata TaxID=66713 RepID=A0AA88YNS1_PINIB|nr:hypothetical protein FSP39_000938 [Pinctada imbricata]
MRYHIVIRPRVIKLYLILAWTLVVGLSVAPSIMWIGYPPVRGICGFFVVLRRSYIKGVCIIMFTIIGLQIVMYLHIFAVAVSKILQDRKQIGNVESRKTIQMWWKPAKVVLIIVGSNACTMAPVAVYMFMVTEGRFDTYTDKEKEILLTYIAAPCFLNSVLNPILYSFQIPGVKKAFLKTFYCCSRSDKNEQNSTAWTAWTT